MNAKVTSGSRILLGLLFTVFGLNGFLQFMPMPPLPEAAGQFMGALGATGYFFPFLKVVEIATGVLLLANRFVPLALLILAPIVVQIILFHGLMAPGGLVLPIIILIAGILVAKGHWAQFTHVVQAKNN